VACSFSVGLADSGHIGLPIQEVLIMQRLAIFILVLLCISAALAQSSPYSNRAEALKGLGSQDATQRAEAAAWIASHGKPADGKLLQQRLVDESPLVRGVAEQGLWLLWSRSGDKAIDALMAKGIEEMQAGQFKESIATFSEAIRRKPAFAEGWNKRATVLFLAGEFRKSLADCDEVMKRNRYHFGALAGYGQIYFQQERYDKAIKYWKRALQVNPNMMSLEINIKAAEQLMAESPRQST
jgi:tetratricopeptide (TPR) repeat protein